MTPLTTLIADLNLVLSQELTDDASCCAIVARRLAKVLRPDWLPPDARASGTEGYGRHLLFEDPQGRFSIGSFVWMPGQATPVHDHRCWGVMGVAQGRLASENFAIDDDRTPRHTSSVVLPAGFIAWLSPALGDIHRIVNRATRTIAVSIHVYGARFEAVCRTRYEYAKGTIAPMHAQSGTDWRGA